jgi:hypothetical protein
MQEVCPNCGSVLTGKYCANCGQKKITEKDMTVLHFIADAAHWITHFDGKFFKSVKYLVARPGFLLKEFFDKKRAAYLSPVALFLLISLFLYLFGVKLHILHNFNILNELEEGTWVTKQVYAYCEQYNLSLQQFAREFNIAKMPFQKLIYFTFVPILGILSQALFFWKKRYFAEHLVFGIYYTCGYIVLLLTYVLLVSLWQLTVTHTQENSFMLGTLALVLLIYTWFMIREGFSLTWWQATIFSLPLTLAMLYLDMNLNNWAVIHLTVLSKFMA